ncbi:hypothetical protein BC831DRAFT_456261 [Entophlyctis helioformis]|nr:hypothetical protein BC831DRAFT_456250 [Entophlyctis helioformis]KAI8926462.1 hypothetical protein BC831DRAFT_456261 [Entophlyctis helioformis]
MAASFHKICQFFMVALLALLLFSNIDSVGVEAKCKAGRQKCKTDKFFLTCIQTSANTTRYTQRRACGAGTKCFPYKKNYVICK